MSSKTVQKEEMSNFEAFSIVFIFIGFILNGVLIFQGLHDSGESVIFPTIFAIGITLFILSVWAIPNHFISSIPLIRDMWWIASLLVLYWIPFKSWFI